MLNKLANNFRSTILVDLGSSRLRMMLPGVGVVVDEAFLVARQAGKRYVGINTPKKSRNKSIIAWGDKALAMSYVGSKQVEVVSPVVRGVVVDFEMAVEVVTRSLAMVAEVPQKKMFLLKPFVKVAISAGLSDMERRIVEQVFVAAGAGGVVMVPSISQVNQNKKTGLFLDVGLDKSEIVFFEEGEMVGFSVIRLGGRDFDNALSFYFKMRYGLEIGPRNATRLKKQLSENQTNLVVVGKQLSGGLPTSMSILKSEFEEALHLEKARLAKHIKTFMENYKGEVDGDLLASGMVLFGAGSLLFDLDKFLSVELGIPCSRDNEVTLKNIFSLL